MLKMYFFRAAGFTEFPGTVYDDGGTRPRGRKCSSLSATHCGVGVILNKHYLSLSNYTVAILTKVI